MSILHVVSVSGGKDSAATLLLALQRFGRERVVAIFCDTGNEHAAVYDYLDYLEVTLDIKITRLRASFEREIAAKRMYIARDQRHRREYDIAPVFDAQGRPVPKRDARGNIIMRTVRRDGQVFEEPVQKTRKVGGGRRVRWTNKAKRRALEVLYPTGIPFLDLCLWKGRFPSRKAQFCTEELKTRIAVMYQLELIEAGYHVVSWQGVRRDESENRRNAALFERVDERLCIYRPLVDWTAMQVFQYCRARGLEPNPLYKQGCGRVGCMPCINVKKNELQQIAVRWPEQIDQKAEWEILVGRASKRGYSTFFYKVNGDAALIDSLVFANNHIRKVVEWARTSRGGKQFDMLADLIEPNACASSYGLCDATDEAA
jgi:3'-phosphoadenosine 5'-phosphosulfate sulfotransferase (PAPS reductase)/FAD synthetase